MSINRTIIKIFFIGSLSACIFAFPGCQKERTHGASARTDSGRPQVIKNRTEATEAASDKVPNIIVLYESNNGSTTRMRVGDTLQIELRGSPTTGFGWEIESHERSILTQVGDEGYKEDPKPAPERPLSGLGGTFRFRFKAIAAGQTVLRLVYRRSWESKPTNRVFETTVVVQ